MRRYNPSQIEKKWRQVWQDDQIYAAKDFSSKPKYVVLTEFPYPSGEGMHMGHIREYTIGDVWARYKRLNGFNVLFPMGYDAFGLPTENFAIKNHLTPLMATEKNVANFQDQLERLGFSFDWSRSFKTTDPGFYHWTQWLFLRFYQAGLAYQTEIAVNWCPFCKTGLANEEVINSRHERCDNLVEKKFLKQWMLKITDYADRLIDGLKDVDYPSRVSDQQINWIGRSHGLEINFKLEIEDQLTVFTTRPDTIYGATFLVIAPEHSLVSKLVSPKQKASVDLYLKQVKSKTDLERQANNQTKTGVFSGSYAINPINQQKIPIWIADYVLMNYGRGAVMAVPAHDERDLLFAKQYNLPIKYVIEPIFGPAKQHQLEKEAIVAVVRNPKTNQVLMLDWGKRRNNSLGKLFIGGGIEKGEDALKAANREVIEETGYSNLALVKQLNFKVHNNYYSNVKNADCLSHMTGFLFDLVDETRVDVNLDKNEQDKFTLSWQDISQVSQLVDDQAHKFIYQALLEDVVYEGQGLMINSEHYDGLNSDLAREKISTDLVNLACATKKTNYRLRDWIFSRQRYWGEPIPIIHCPKDGPVAVPDDQLPVTLPDIDDYEPTDSGASPLSKLSSWVNTTCPVCGGPAKRETDTMPNWAGSSWYYLRYFDAKNNQQFASRDKLDYWGAVDFYLGGMEHTTLHLLYSRFWHQFLYDQGLVPTKEPYLARRGQGIILAADGTKMSKSKGNIVNPLDIIDQGYGADAVRLAVTFIAPYDQTTPWSPESVAGTHRFLQRLWTLCQQFKSATHTQTPSSELNKVINQLIKRVSDDVGNCNFNTAVAGLMEAMNSLYLIKAKDEFKSSNWAWALQTFVILLSPFCPYISEELYQELGGQGSVHLTKWPIYDPTILVENSKIIVIQINGKLRAQITVDRDAQQSQIEELARSDQAVSKYLEDKPIKKTIYVKDKLINFVV